MIDSKGGVSVWKKYALLLLSLLLFQFGLASPIHAAEPVKVGVYQNEPLVFTDSDGNVKGIYIDILEYVASKEGWRVQYVPCSWPQCLEWIEGGEIDLLVGIAYSEERDERFDFTDETLLSNWGQIYTRKNSRIQSILDLEGKTIAVLKGDIYYQGLKLLLERFDIDCDFVEVDEYAAVFQLADEGKVDAGVITRLYGLLHEKHYNVDRSTIICCPIELRFAVPENKNQNLANALDAHLAALKNDKESIYYQSLNMWIGGLNGREVFPGWLKWTLAGVVGLLFLFLGGNIVLRAQVQTKTKKLEKEITKCKRAEEALRESEEWYRTLVETSSECICNLDLEGNFLYMNPAGLRFSGMSEDEVIGLHCTKLAKPAYTSLLKETLKKARSGETVRFQYEVDTPSGSMWFESILTPIKDDSGNVIRLLRLSRDITERKEAEEKLKQKIEELERWQKLTVDREVKMMELKKRIEKLESEIKRLRKTQ